MKKQVIANEQFAEFFEALKEKTITPEDATQMLVLVGKAFNAEQLQMIWDKYIAVSDETKQKAQTELNAIFKGHRYPMTIRGLVKNLDGSLFLLQQIPRDHENYKLLCNEIIDAFNTSNLSDGMSNENKRRFIERVVKPVYENDTEYFVTQIQKSFMTGASMGFFSIGDTVSFDEIIIDLSSFVSKADITKIIHSNNGILLQLAGDEETLKAKYPNDNIEPKATPTKTLGGF